MKRWIGLFAILATVTVIVTIYVWYFDECRRISSEARDHGSGPVILNALVGRNLDEIEAEHGNPDTDKAGSHSLTLRWPKKSPKHPVRTLIFRTKDGTLWVWVQRCGDEWRCFESCWFTNNVVLD